MIKIKREMESTLETTKHSYYNCSQAAINSDGVITIRNYNYEDKNNDEIIILSETETRAIFKLVNVLKCKSPELPF